MAGYNKYSGRTYKIKKEKKEDGGQYYVQFDDDKTIFYLPSALTKKEAIEEADGYDDEGLFDINCKF